MQRRSFMKWAAAFPLLAKVGPEQAMGRGWAEVARNSTENIYTRIGVKPLISGGSDRGALGEVFVTIDQEAH
jgi:hypothetical protein